MPRYQMRQLCVVQAQCSDFWQRTHWGHTLSARLLQRCTSMNSCYSDKTAAISSEYRGSFNVKSKTLGVYILLLLHIPETYPCFLILTAFTGFRCGGELFLWHPTWSQTVCQLKMSSVCINGLFTCQVQTTRPIGQRSFAFHGPSVWISLPSALCDSDLSLNMFGWQLKSHLCGQHLCNFAQYTKVTTYILTVQVLLHWIQEIKFQFCFVFFTACYFVSSLSLCLTLLSVRQDHP